MAQDASKQPAPPRLNELLSGFLNRQAAARSAGLAEPPVSDVEPYEAAFAPAVEPRLALEEALAALRLLDPDRAKITFHPPPDWASLVSGTESIAALAFAAGNFPQLLRDLPALIRSERRSSLALQVSSSAATPSLLSWARAAASAGRFPHALFGLGALRTAGQFDSAAEVLRDLRTKTPERWHLALANEVAALAWHRGQTQQAAKAWNDLPESAPILFNRGMAALFLDRPAEARPALTKAIALLPDEDSWHHLAKLYLALAET